MSDQAQESDDVLMSDQALESDGVPIHSSQPDDTVSIRKRRLSSEAGESQLEGESQTSAASVDQELSCGICLDLLTIPYTIIPCLHTFDKECLMEWWKRNSNCPTCKKNSTSAKSAFQLRAIMDHVHKRKKRKPLPVAGTNTDEIFPPNGGLPAAPYYDDDLDSDDEGSDDDLAENILPGDGLIWPCNACIPNNPTGYTCPTPLPSPTMEQIQEELARRPAGSAVGPPHRGHRRMSLESAVTNGIPGANDHSQCVGCGTYVPLGYPRGIKCGGCSEVHCNNFDPAGCPTAMHFYPRSDVKLTPHTILTLTFLLPPLLKQNRHEVSRFTNYINARNLSLGDILAALFEAKRSQVAEDLNDEAADEHWGPDTWFCDRCVIYVTTSMLFDWWVRERRTSLERQDGIILAKPDCWYGRECRTQTHNDAHAERHNHICENTRRPDV